MFDEIDQDGSGCVSKDEGKKAVDAILAWLKVDLTEEEKKSLDGAFDDLAKDDKAMEPGEALELADAVWQSHSEEIVAALKDIDVTSLEDLWCEQHDCNN